MLTKQPDYTISELGCPQLRLLCSDGFYKKCPSIAPSLYQSSQSPTRLLPLRETLDDYNKRLLAEQAEIRGAGRRRDLAEDLVAQQKWQKNLSNEQQKLQQQQQRDRSNQKCRDNKKQAARTTTKANCDLNSF